MTKVIAEFFGGHFRQPVQTWVHQAGARAKFLSAGHGSLPVPGANILADIAAKDMAADARAQIFGDRAALFDGQVRDATIGIKLIRSDDGLGGTGLNAAGASAAAVRSRQIGREIERGKDHAKKEP